MIKLLLAALISSALAHGSASLAFWPTVNPLLMSSSPSTVRRLVAPFIVDPVQAFVGRPLSHVLAKASEARLSVFTEAPAVANSDTALTIVFKSSHVSIVAAADHGFPNAVQQRSATAVSFGSDASHFAVVATAGSGSSRGKVHTEDNFSSAAEAAALPSDDSAARRERDILQLDGRQSTELPSGQIDRLGDRRRFPHVILTHESPSGFVYPKECCGGHECRPIACSTIRDNPDGSVEWTGLVFQRNQVKISGDAMCHVCVGYDQVRKTQRYPHCIFLSPVM